MRGAKIVGLEVEVDRGEVLRYLGYPAGQPGSARIEARLSELWPRAVALLAPAGAFREVGEGELRQAGMPEPPPRAAVAACTIGPGLEAEGARRAEAGAIVDALVLDAFGSAAAEAAADALNLRLCHLARSAGLFAAPRVSPGYGRWETARQGALLALLPAADLGIALTSGQMMVPRKSVSFAVGFLATAPPPAAAPCAHCGLIRCRHRMAPPGGGVEDCG